MFNDDATQPDLQVQRADEIPWPLPPQGTAPHPQRAGFWSVLVLSAVVLFGAGSGITILLTHGSTIGGPSLGGPGPLPTATYSSTTSPISSPSPTATSQPSPTPTPTPRHHHHGG
jgi:hypothetical protein